LVSAASTFDCNKVTAFDEDLNKQRAERRARFKQELDEAKRLAAQTFNEARARLARVRQEIDQTVASTPSHLLNHIKLAEVRASLNQDEVTLNTVYNGDLTTLSAAESNFEPTLAADMQARKIAAVKALWTALFDQRLEAAEKLRQDLTSNFVTRLQALGKDIVFLHELRLSVLELGAWDQRIMGGCSCRLDVCPPLLNSCLKLDYGAGGRNRSCQVKDDHNNSYWNVPLLLTPVKQDPADMPVSAIPLAERMRMLAALPDFDSSVMAKQNWTASTIVGHTTLLEQLVLSGNCDVLDKIPRTAVPGSVLMSAVHARNADKLVGILVARHGANVNHCAPNGLTPLLAAVLARNEPLIQTCLALGADCNARLDDGSCVLSHAISKNLSLTTIRRIEANPFGPARFTDGYTPLAGACASPHASAEMVTAVVKEHRKTDPLADGQSLFHVSAGNTNGQAARLLEELRRLFGFRSKQLEGSADNYGRRPVEIAQQHGNYVTFQALQGFFKSKIRFQQSEGPQVATALERAIFANDEPAVTFVVRNRQVIKSLAAPAEALGKAVAACMQTHNLDMLELVVQLVPNVATFLFAQNKTLAHLVIEGGLAAWLPRVIQFGVDYRAWDVLGKDILDLALEADDAESVDAVLKTEPAWHGRATARALELGATKCLELDLKPGCLELHLSMATRPVDVHLAVTSGYKLSEKDVRMAASTCRLETFEAIVECVGRGNAFLRRHHARKRPEILAHLDSAALDLEAIGRLVQFGDGGDSAEELSSILEATPIGYATFDQGYPLLHWAVLHRAYWVFKVVTDQDPTLRWGVLNCTAFDLLAIHKDAHLIFDHVRPETVLAGLSPCFAILTKRHEGSPELYKRLCEKCTSSEGWRLLISAMSSTQDPTTHLVRLPRVDSWVDSAGRSILMHCVAHEQYLLALSLIPRGSWRHQTRQGDTVLHQLARLPESKLRSPKVKSRVHNLVQSLLRYGDDLCRIENHKRWTPWLDAAAQGHTGLLCLLYQYDPAVIYHTDQKGRSALHLAAYGNHVNSIRFLVNKLGMDPNSPARGSTSRGTSLHSAAAGGGLEASDELLRLGARGSAVDEHKRTALMVAASKGDPRVVSLLSLHSDWSPSCAAGVLLALCSARSAAAHIPLLQHFLGRMNLNPNVCDEDGWYLVHLAMARDDVSMFKVLLDYEADCAVGTRSGDNVLHVAALTNAVSCTSLLCRRFNCASLLRQQNREGQTPCHMAASKAHMALLTIWLSQPWSDSVVMGELLNSKLERSSACAEESACKSLLQSFETDKMTDPMAQAALRKRSCPDQKNFLELKAAEDLAPVNVAGCLDLAVEAQDIKDDKIPDKIADSDGQRAILGMKADDAPRHIQVLLRVLTQRDSPAAWRWFEAWCESCVPDETNSKKFETFLHLTVGLVLPEPCHIVDFDALLQALKAAKSTLRQIQLDLLHTVPQGSSDIVRGPITSSLLTIPAVDGLLPANTSNIETLAAAQAAALDRSLAQCEVAAARAVLELCSQQQIPASVKFGLLRSPNVCLHRDINVKLWPQLLAAGVLVAQKFGEDVLAELLQQQDLVQKSSTIAYQMPLHVEPADVKRALKSTRDLAVLAADHALADSEPAEVVRRMLTRCDRTDLHKFPFDGRPMFPISDTEGHELSRQGQTVAQTMQENLTDAELLARLTQLNTAASSLNLAERVALTCLAFKRVYRITPYTVQRLVILCLFREDHKSELKNERGRLAQVATGEGKSLIVAVAAAVRALQSRVVDVISSTRQLAARDQREFAPFFRFLGLTSSVVGEDHQSGFDAQIVYGTNTDFEFALLLQLVTCKKILWTNNNPRPKQDALVDESDSLLLDAARQSARIAWPSEIRHEWVYALILEVTRSSDADEDMLSVLARAQDAVRGHNAKAVFSERQLTSWLASARQAMRKVRGRDYIVQTCPKTGKKQVVIMDLLTGRRQEGCRWSAGVHEMVEKLEDIEPEQETLTIASVAHPSFFKLYDKVFCLTGTGGEAVERAEIQSGYDISTFDMCPNKPCMRKRGPTRIFSSHEALDCALLEELKNLHGQGCPLLLLFTCINECEAFSEQLRGVVKEWLILTDCQNQHEAHIVFRAGQRGAVTLATNAAGRGTDIRPTPEAERLGGLHVFMIGFPENFRVECQGLGRAGRGGKPGFCCVWTWAQDPFFKTIGFVCPEVKVKDGIVDDSTLRSLYAKREEYVALTSEYRQQHYRAEAHIFRGLQIFFQHYAHLHAKAQLVRADQQEFWRRKLAKVQSAWAKHFSDPEKALDDNWVNKFVNHLIRPLLLEIE
jgi:ankyrin repeat protein